MKTKEFIKKVEELGFKVEFSPSNVLVKDSIERAVAQVSRINYLRTDSVSWDFGLVSDISRGILFDLIIEYAKTPIDEREEEK